MARTGLAYEDRFLEHLTGPTHPERPDRLRATMRELKSTGLLERMIRLPATPASDEILRLNHSQAYIERVEHACAADDPFIDSPDSAICPESESIARLAVGAVIAACDAVMSANIDNAFCAV